MQTDTAIDEQLTVQTAQQLAQRLASPAHAIERLNFVSRLKQACRLADKPAQDDGITTYPDEAVYLCCSHCFRTVGELLAAQAAAERGLLLYPSSVALMDELASIHDALAVRYRAVARRCQAALVAEPDQIQPHGK